MSTKHNFKDSPGMIIVTGLLLGVFLVVLSFFFPSLTRSLNDKLTDLVMAGAAKKPLSGSVVILEVDERSLAQIGQWPWSRFQLAQLLQKTQALVPKTIVLDMILAEQDRTASPQTGLEAQVIFRNKAASQDFMDEVKKPDQYLAETLANGPFVLGYNFLFHPNDNENKKGQHPIKYFHDQRYEQHSSSKVNEAQGVVGNLKIFEEAVSQSGFLNATPDHDGILRRMPMLVHYQDEFYPSLVLSSYLHYQKPKTLYPQQVSGFIDWLQLGELKIPLDSRGNFLIDFHRWDAQIPTYSATDLLAGLVPQGSFTDKIVLIGSSASGVAQTYQTTEQPVVSGVSIHAYTLETLLNGVFPIRNTNFLVLENGIALLLALLFSLCIAKSKSQPVANGVFSIVFILLLVLCTKVLYQATNFLFSPLLPILVILSEYSILTIVKTRQRQQFAEVVATDTLMLLKHSENKLNSIIESIPDIIFRLDSTGKINFISPAISHYVDNTDALLGQPIMTLVSPEDVEKATYRVNERRTGNRATQNLEIRMLLTKEGASEPESYRYFNVSAQGLYESRDDVTVFVGTQGIVRDITDQKMLEEQLLKAQKLEAVGNLAAGVAHDLNNVLSGLVSYPELLLLELPKDSPLRGMVQTIQQSGEKAAAIVQDMLTLARRGVATKDIYSLNTIITDYFSSPEMSTLQEKHPGIEFVTNLSGDTMKIMGSPVHLAKSLMNLISNAAEAMPVGGRIVVSTKNIYLDTALEAYELIPEGEYVLLRVKDDGVGIAKEDLGKIFEPFFTKKKMGRSGTGLGMTIIWATVKDEGGYVDIMSQEGMGTQFDIYIPPTRETENGKDHKSVLEDYLGSERILVVDDIREQRELAISMLTKLGYKVISASSGESALSVLQKQTVDLVILDMIMPGGMDGLDTYKKIIEAIPGQKAIIASGFSESERVKHAQQLGAGEYIQKPYTLSKIGLAVRHELDRNLLSV